MRKVSYFSVNRLAVSDDKISIIILKKPKQRYRTIIRAYYKRSCRYRRLN